MTSMHTLARLALHLATSAATVVSLSGVACKKTEETTSDAAKAAGPTIAAEVPPAVDDSALAGLLATAGDGAPLVIALHDAGWTRARDRAVGMFTGGVPEELKPLAEAADGPAVVAALARWMDLSVGEPSWAGRDATRPLVLSMFEAPFSGPPGAAIAQMAGSSDQHFPARHQLLVPASDRDALMKSLRAWLGEGATETPALVEGKAGAVGITLERSWPEQTFVALVPEGEHVRVVVLDRGRGIEDPAVLRRWVDVEAKPLPQTPALRHVTRADDPVALLVRPWHFRALAVWFGMSEVHRVLDTVSADQRDVASARGNSIVALVELLTPDDNAELDDWSFVLQGDDTDLRLTTVASLTPAGRKVWEAAAKRSVAPLTVKTAGAAEMFVGADVGAMLAAAPRHDLTGARISEIARGFTECGVFCPLFAAMRWPISVGATVAPTVPETSTFTKSGQLVGLQVVATAFEPQPQLAFALVVTPGASLGGMKTFFDEVGLARSMQIHETKRGEDPVLLMGVGVDPRTVFDTSAAGDPTGSVLTASWAASAPMPPPLRSVEAKARVRATGSALVSEIVVGSGALRFEPDHAKMEWASPMRSAPSSEAASCLRDAVAGFQQGFDAITSVTRDARSKILAKVLAGIEPALQCARKDATLAPAADRLADTLASIAAGMYVADFDIDGARALLQPRCTGGRTEGEACERLAAMGKAKSVTIETAKTAPGCGEETYYGLGLPVIVDGDAISVGGEMVEADAQAIAAALVEHSDMGARAAKEASAVGLVVARDTPMARMTPVLEAIAAVNAKVGVVIADDAGERRKIAVKLEWASAVTVDWKVPPRMPTDAFELPEEEPPPELEEPEAHAEPPAEGKMGLPSSKKKSGLYAMKGPKDAIPQMGILGEMERTPSGGFVFEVDGSGVTAVAPDGAETKLADADAIAEAIVLALRKGGLFSSVVVSAADDATWAQTLAVIVAGCDGFPVLKQP